MDHNQSCTLAGFTTIQWTDPEMRFIQQYRMYGYKVANIRYLSISYFDYVEQWWRITLRLAVYDYVEPWCASIQHFSCNTQQSPTITVTMETVLIQGARSLITYPHYLLGDAQIVVAPCFFCLKPPTLPQIAPSFVRSAIIIRLFLSYVRFSVSRRCQKQIYSIPFRAYTNNRRLPWRPCDVSNQSGLWIIAIKDYWPWQSIFVLFFATSFILI